jgi:hypothetical protein
VEVLLAAKAWGTPPWEIAGGPKLLWLNRYRLFEGLVAQKLSNSAGSPPPEADTV